MELTVQNVYGLLLRSKLMPPDEARAMFQRWQADAGDTATSLPHFLKWLTARGYVTEYQATLLARGHAEGFFLNQYKILDRLGKGRMAGVYKARHETGQVVAIKVLPPSRGRDPNFLARFQREGRLASRLHHPNIVRVFQVGKAGDVHYLVMEHIEGETLDEVLKRRGKLPPTEAVRLVYLALLGLQHIHERGLVHRDLKPANLMLTPAPEPGPNETTLRSQVKILDIGLARPQGEEAMAQNADEGELTTEGVLLGTPDYMAPEQARDARAADIRSDIYSLGCVLYHALAGQTPFPDTNLINQMIRHATEPPRPLRELNPAVPDGLQQIVNWMLAKDPGQRYPTPERAAEALKVFLAAGTPAPQSPAAPDKQLKTYLDWVESENTMEDMQQPAALRPPPAAKAAPPPSPPVAKPAARETPTRPPRKEAPKAAEKKARPAPAEVPVAAPVAPPPSEAEPEFDVELVPASPPPPPPPRKKGRSDLFSLQLTPRDFVMFGVGVAGTLLAIGLAMLLASLLARKPPPSPPEDTAPQPAAAAAANGPTPPKPALRRTGHDA